MNDVLVAFISTHSSCFEVSKREPNGIILEARQPKAKSIYRPDGSILAVACECKNEEAVLKTLQKAGIR